MLSKPKIIIAEDDLLYRSQIVVELKNLFEIIQVETIKEVLTHIQRNSILGILLDKTLKDGICLHYLQEIQKACPKIKIIIMTVDPDSTFVRPAMDSGAISYLRKPPLITSDDEQTRKFFGLIKSEFLNSEEKGSVQQTKINSVLSSYIHSDQVKRFFGRSKFTQDTKLQIRRCHGVSSPILITGESGSGKSYIAEIISEQESKLVKTNRNIKILDCITTSPEQLEYELFGSNIKPNSNNSSIFETISGGDLVLENIEFLTPHLQEKLFNVIEYGEFTKLGSAFKVWTNFRLIATSQEDLKRSVIEGSFLESLYYRITTNTIKVLPLRSRIEDVLDLAPYFLLRSAGIKFTIPYPTFLFLQNHHWPGNLKELEYLTQLACMHAKTRGRFEIQPEDFYLISSKDKVSSVAELFLPRSITDVNYNSYKKFKNEAEKSYLNSAFQICKGDISFAHKRLNISRSTLYNKLSSYNIQYNSTKTDLLEPPKTTRRRG